MALLTPHPFTSDFDQVKQPAEVGGDWYKADAMVRLWVQNLDPTQELTVTAAEQKQCSHPHHGIFNRAFTVVRSGLLVLPALDVSYMADSDRLIQFTYSAFSTGQTVVWVAAMRSAER